MLCQSGGVMAWGRGAVLALALALLVCCGAAPTDILYRMPEEQPPNTLIGSLAADEGLPDTGHLYKLEVGAPYLRVDGKTGEIYTTEIPIDRESLRDCRNLFEGAKCFLEFEVSITDLIMGQGQRLIEGRIEVLDVNDNTPQFASPILTLSIPENTHIGALFAIPMATDKDSGHNGVAEYSLSMGHDASQLFNLQVAEDTDEKLPQLIVMGNLDREQKDSYYLNIRVVDGGVPPRASSALLRVSVTDQNDNAPKFERTHYEAELPENSPMGHSVLQVKANDADLATNGEIDYSLHQASDTVQRLLRIDRSTGVISVKGLVDREEENFLKFFVVAKDRGPNSKSSKVLVTIIVKDQNDNAPAIEIRGIGLVTHQNGVANISEDMPIGTAVAQVQVSDRDEGENAVVTCVVAGDVPFQLRSASESANDRKRKYFLHTTTLLDYERVKDYRIEIVAVDSGNPALSSTNSLKVQVTDMNDNAPVFSPAVFEVDFDSAPTDILYRMPEEQPPNTLIGSLAADEGLPDTGHLYKLEVGAPYLRVDGKTGEIYTTEIPIDRESLKDCRNLFEGAKCFLEFEVSITDLIMEQGQRLIEGRIEVLDVNDNTPQFASPILTLSIPENTHIGALFAIPMATDKDSGHNGVAEYSLSTGHDASQLFNLQVAEDMDEKLPQLIVMGNLDREQKASYDLNIRVVDGGVPPRASSALLRVSVTDQNDNAPKFERTHYEAELPENSPMGHSVLQVKANDADLATNGEIDYSLHQASYTVQRLLRIDRSTGVISVKGLVDREEENFLKFFVVAKDRGPNSKSSKVLVTIIVKDQNDNAPAIEIRGIGLVTHQNGVANISEDMPIGTVVALVQVSDRDEGENAVVTCVVAGDVPFQLRSASESANDRKRKYFLHTTTLLDYERVKDYRIEIVAVNSGNPALSSTNSLKVQVTDMNDNAPVFSPAVFEVDFAEENQPGDKVLDVIATDADSGSNAELTYSIIVDSATKGLFEIDPNTGEVRVRNQLDREHREHYEFHVAASDKGSPSLRGTATVMVRVLDRNDNDPKFMLSGYSFSVLENMPPLSPVGMVTVIDADKGENARVRLTVEPDNGKFIIQNGTGTILSSISFDREKESTYTFRLRAVDAGDPPRSSYVGVTINVLDENDNAPYVTRPSNSTFKFLPPLTAPETRVAVVEAEDMDTGPNAELVYSITGGNPHGLFHISPNSGEITLAEELARKHNGLHRLVVRVNDKGKPQRHTTALVHIFVNETIANVTLIESLVGHSLYTPLDRDIAGDPNYAQAQRSNILYGSLAGLAGVLLVIVAVVVVRHRLQKDAKSGYQAGKKESKDLYAPKQGPKNGKGKKSKKGKAPKPAKPLEEDEEASLQKGLKFNLINDSVSDSPRIHLPLNYPPGSPDLGRHYRSNSPLPSIQLQPQSPSASKKHQAVQDLPATNTFVGTGDNNSDYSYKANPPKYSSKQVGDYFVNSRNITWNTWGGRPGTGSQKPATSKTALTTLSSHDHAPPLHHWAGSSLHL